MLVVRAILRAHPRKMFVFTLFTSNITWAGTNRPTHYAHLRHAAFCHSLYHFLSVVCYLVVTGHCSDLCDSQTHSSDLWPQDNNI